MRLRPSLFLDEQSPPRTKHRYSLSMLQEGGMFDMLSPFNMDDLFTPPGVGRVYDDSISTLLNELSQLEDIPVTPAHDPPRPTTPVLELDPELDPELVPSQVLSRSVYMRTPPMCGTHTQNSIRRRHKRMRKHQGGDSRRAVYRTRLVKQGDVGRVMCNQVVASRSVSHLSGYKPTIIRQWHNVKRRQPYSSMRWRARAQTTTSKFVLSPTHLVVRNMPKVELTITHNTHQVWAPRRQRPPITPGTVIRVL